MSDDRHLTALTDQQARDLDETRRLLYVALALRDRWDTGPELTIHQAELEGTLVNRVRHWHRLDTDDELERWVGYLVIRRAGKDVNDLGVAWGRDLIARISTILEAREASDAGT